MFGRLIPLLLVGAAAYWYWTGPYQESKNPSYEQKLRQNEENLGRCMRAESYAAGATGEVRRDPEIHCAEQYNLYREDGRWHSYDDVRPD